MSRAITRSSSHLAADDPELRLRQTERIARDMKRLMREGMPHNTFLAYSADFADFERWCQRQTPAFVAIPTSEEAIIGYLTEASEQRRPSGAFSVRAGTIERRLSGIAWAHAIDNHLSPRTPRVAKLMHAIKVKRSRDGERPPKKAAPLTLVDLRKICRHLDDAPSQATTRDRALILIGWVCALRRSEIAALDLGDVGRITAEGFVLTIRRSKTDQEGAGRSLPVASEEGTLCPVAALQSWLAIRGEGPGPLFWRSWRSKIHADKAISEKQVARAVRRLVVAAGLKPEIKELDFSAHSLRAGFITEAVRAGHRDGEIMDRSGHKSHEVFMGYVRIAQTFQNNPARGFSKWGKEKP